MSNTPNGAAQGTQSEAELAQAFSELQRGEQTAAALESHLDSLEKKIEELLAQAEKAEAQIKADSEGRGPSAPGTQPDAESSS